MSDLDTCRMGDRCRTRTPNGDGTTTPGDADGRGLCWPDEIHGRLAIEQLPHQWARLTLQVGKDAGRNGLATMGGNKAEAPIPLRLDIDALARNVAWALDVWAAAVWELLPVVEQARRRDFAETGVRPGFAVARSAGLLVRWYPALRALGPTVHMPYGDNHTEPTEDDGPGAIVQLADLHHRAQSVLGDNMRYERRELPCPPAPHGCGLEGTLAREIGESVVRCRNCGWWCTDLEYDMYAVTFMPPKVGRCPGCNGRPGAEHGDGCEVARCLQTGLGRFGCAGGHECGRDVWTGIWPGVTEAQRYGVDLNTLTAEGTWDPAWARWYLGEDAP